MSGYYEQLRRGAMGWVGGVTLMLLAAGHSDATGPSNAAANAAEPMVKIGEITPRFITHTDLRVWEWAGSNLVTRPSHLEATSRGTVLVRDGSRVLELSDADGDGRADSAQETPTSATLGVDVGSDLRIHTLVETNRHFILTATPVAGHSGPTEILGTGFGPGHAVADSFGNVWFADLVEGHGPRVGLVFRGGNHRWSMDNDLAAIHTPAAISGGGVDALVAYENSPLPNQRLGWSLLLADANAGRITMVAGLSQSFQPRGFFTNLLQPVAGEPFAPIGLAIGSEGSILVADRNGRILRVGPTNTPARFPILPNQGTNALLARLRSPSAALQAEALSVARGLSNVWPFLGSVYVHERDATVRARAIWVAAALGKPGRKWVMRALSDRDPNLRITALRAHSALEPERLSTEWPEWWKLTTNYPQDMFPSVRRLHALHLPAHDSAARLERLLVLSTNAAAADRMDFEAFAVAAGKNRPALRQRLTSLTNLANPTAVSNLVLTLKAFEEVR